MRSFLEYLIVLLPWMSSLSTICLPSWVFQTVQLSVDLGPRDSFCMFESYISHLILHGRSSMPGQPRDFPKYLHSNGIAIGDLSASPSYIVLLVLSAEMEYRRNKQGSC